MSAKAGWYPDPGGGQGLFRYWDGKSWSAATSPNPGAAPPNQGLARVGLPGGGSAVGQPGGAVGLAALLAGRLDVAGKNVVIVLSGGNVDADLFSELVA